MTQEENKPMNDEIEPTNTDEVQHDGLAMLGILVLTVALLILLGYNIL